VDRSTELIEKFLRLRRLPAFLVMTLFAWLVVFLALYATVERAREYLASELFAYDASAKGTWRGRSALQSALLLFLFVLPVIAAAAFLASPQCQGRLRRSRRKSGGH
jgi:hypothetical protein